jgi:predicted phage-related endonuclease
MENRELDGVELSFQRLEEIEGAMSMLEKEKKQLRASIEELVREHGEITAGGYKATWTPASESVSYPTKTVKEWIIRNAGQDFVADFVQSCQQTSVRNGSLRITKQK